MRLFKLLVIAIIVGSAYLYAKQHSNDSDKWQTVTTPSGVSIQFPQQPISKSLQRDLPVLGRINLMTYQSAQDNHIFILLLASPSERSNQQKDIQRSNLHDLEAAIHAMNDTTQLTITDKRAFLLQSQPGLEYKATNPHGAVIWCRTVKIGNQLLSIIYGSSKPDQDNRLRDSFFQSFRL